MEPQEVTYNEVVSYVSGQIMSGPEDAIWDDILDWILNAISTITSNISEDIANAILKIGGAIASVTSQFVSALHPLFTDVQLSINTFGDNVVRVMNSLDKLSVDIISATGREATRVINEVGTLVQTVGSTVESIIRTISTTLIPAINSVITTIGATISSTTASILASIASFYASVVATTTKAFADISTTISTFFTSISEQIQANMDWLTTTLLPNIRKEMDAWWDDFLDKIFDFPSWVGKLFDAIETWVTRDIPGGSPWWQTVIEKFWYWLWSWIKFYSRKWGAEIRYTIAWLLVEVGKPFAETFLMFFTDFIDRVSGEYKVYKEGIPTSDAEVKNSLKAVATTVLSGLIGMTLAGELTVLASKLGFGQIGAMIYDMTNYKLLTGAFVGALSLAAIKTPLTYYYNSQFRPNLPRLRDASDFYARDQLTKPQFYQLLTYEGYADIYHDKFADVAYRAVSLFPLASLANTGVFDETLFMDNLRDLGLKPKWRDLLLQMYKAKAIETVKGTMSSVAITRFKEGFTTEDQFTSELKMLRCSDEEIPIYIASAKLSYASDYTADLITAFRDAVRAGNISISEYRDQLLGLGIVPDRVEGYVLIEIARVKPAAAPKPLAPPKATYTTDAGKVQVDTIRRKRRKGIITRDEEIAGMLELGMDVDMATAYADNDDARLGEKATTA